MTARDKAKKNEKNQTKSPDNERKTMYVQLQLFYYAQKQEVTPRQVAH